MRQRVAAALLAATTVFAVATRAEIIDRILAVVNGTLILQSDVTMATRLGLASSPAAPDPSPAPLDALIERRLVLEEVDRYAPADPSAADVDRRLAEVRDRAGAGFEAVLRDTGVSIDQVRRQVRDDLRIEAYLLQRFGAMQPSDDEIQQYYRDHQSEFVRNGAIRPLDDVRDVLRAKLIASQRGVMIKDWVAGLRRRATVNILPR